MRKRVLICCTDESVIIVRVLTFFAVEGVGYRMREGCWWGKVPAAACTRHHYLSIQPAGVINLGALYAYGYIGTAMA